MKTVKEGGMFLIQPQSRGGAGQRQAAEAGGEQNSGDVMLKQGQEWQEVASIAKILGIELYTQCTCPQITGSWAHHRKWEVTSGLLSGTWGARQGMGGKTGTANHVGHTGHGKQFGCCPGLRGIPQRGLSKQDGTWKKSRTLAYRALWDCVMKRRGI